MPQEVEIKLSVLPQDMAALAAHPLLQGPSRELRLENAYLDTPTLDLRAARMALRVRRIGRRELLTVKTAAASVGGLSRRGEWEVPRPRGRPDFARIVDDADLAGRLNTWAPALTEVFRTDFSRRTWLVHHAGARIEIARDDGWIVVGAAGRPRRERILELELELLDGPEDALLDLAHTLVLGPQGRSESALRLRPAQRSKAERGYALFQREALAPVKAGELHLEAHGSLQGACRAACLACLSHLQANEAGLLARIDATHLPDPEFVHQARVALRRLRTGLRLFREHLPEPWVAHWSAHWKGLADVLGQARNWDVFATEGLPGLLPDTDAREEARALRAWVLAQRIEANRRAAAVLAEPAHALALLAFTRSVLALHASRRVDLGAWATGVLRDGHAGLRRQAREARRLGPDGRHELRLALKKLRYAQEFLASLLPPKRVARSTATLAEAQTLLGELNDLSTAQTLLQQAPATLAPSLIAQMQAGLQAQLEAGLLALPTMERALESATTPWR